MLGAFLGISFLAALSAAPQAGQYEQPPSFSASQVLPPNLLRSPYYTVGNRVGLDDFQFVFQVDTKWGAFGVEGSDLMRVRAREIAATAKMEEIGGAETVVDAAGRTALKPLATAKDLVTAPGKTIGDTFKGVGNIFGSAGASMSATDPHKEGVVASLTGGATARRKLAYSFGVDPNTSFPPLSEELTRLATANAIGETGVNAGLAFVTGGAGIAISVGGTSRTLRLALRDKTAAQLEQSGRATLASIGVSSAAADVFYANPNLSPTDKFIIVEALAGLGGTASREIFIAGAANAKSIEMGFFYRRQAELIAAYDKKISPVTAFLRMGGAPMLQTGNGTVSILPVDYLYWSPPLESLLAGAGRGGEMWITGRASQRATAQLAAHGWSLVPKAGGRLGE
ncbi:MAG TPA: hypothetical protein VHK26_05460 [Methyloceanibacter sp.]|jgi:hypothetical protein|nr:hypothetical protein [Methyloceanibacter sp.]